MPKIPCLVESGPQGGRRGNRHAAGEGRRLFPAEKSPHPSPGPPSFPQKPLIRRTEPYRESREKTDRMTRQAEMEKSGPASRLLSASRPASWLLSPVNGLSIRDQVLPFLPLCASSLTSPCQPCGPFRLQAVFPSNGARRLGGVRRMCGTIRPGALRTIPGTKGGAGSEGAWGRAGPAPLTPRRAGDPAWMPGNGHHPTAISQSASGSIPASVPPKKRKGPVLQKKTGPFAKSGSAQTADVSISCRRHAG